MSDLTERIEDLEKSARILGEMVATLRVNFGPAGREQKILDGSEKPVAALFKVLRVLSDQAKQEGQSDEG